MPDAPDLVEVALAILMDSDGRVWSDDRIVRWRDVLTSYPRHDLLPETARAYARQRYVNGGHDPVEPTTFGAHYRGLLALEAHTAPTPPPPDPTDPLLERDAALAAVRALRETTYLGRTPPPPEPTT